MRVLVAFATKKDDWNTEEQPYSRISELLHTSAFHPALKFWSSVHSQTNHDTPTCYVHLSNARLAQLHFGSLSVRRDFTSKLSLVYGGITSINQPFQQPTNCSMKMN